MESNQRDHEAQLRDNQKQADHVQQTYETRLRNLDEKISSFSGGVNSADFEALCARVKKIETYPLLNPTNLHPRDPQVTVHEAQIKNLEAAIHDLQGQVTNLRVAPPNSNAVDPQKILLIEFQLENLGRTVWGLRDEVAVLSRNPPVSNPNPAPARVFRAYPVHRAAMEEDPNSGPTFKVESEGAPQPPLTTSQSSSSRPTSRAAMKAPEAVLSDLQAQLRRLNIQAEQSLQKNARSRARTGP